jgi:hypothetical protein
LFKKVSLGLMLGLMLSALSIGTAFAGHTPVTFTVEQEKGSNRASFFENLLENMYPEAGEITCVKTDQAVDPVATGDEFAIIVKAGTKNFVFVNPHAGTYSAPNGKDTSHFIVCFADDAEAPGGPGGGVGGPCYDPAHYAIFDNLAGSQTLTFRMRFDSETVVKQIVPAGEIFRSRLVWAKGGTIISIAYKNPETGMWVNLFTKTAEFGTYPRCEYERGFSTDPIGTFEPDLRSAN